eukprot:TRINITY_DN475_c0_g1_i3.p1 TRINITY_DN475_c0_g1~~TRINITY_DN475_c0_g1_i3.p1  ORF type:complete len:354 (+),score=76.50 TRINITY_DN475_c0_g1_i3:201-1262(+)
MFTNKGDKMLKVACLIALSMLALCAEGKGMGSRAFRSTRTYTKPSTAKYALAAAGGVVLGAGAYHVMAGRYNHRSYSDYYRRRGFRRSGYDETSANADEDFSNNNTTPSTPCYKRELPDESKTRAWVIGQMVVKNLTMLVPGMGGLEIDLFRDVSWRAQCSRPTQVLITLRCTVQRTPPSITDADMDNPSVCGTVGSESARNSFGRGRGLLSGGTTVVEFYVGTETDKQARHLKLVVDEVLADEEGDVMVAYEGAATAQPTTIDYGTSNNDNDSHSFLSGFVAMIVLAVAVSAGCFVFTYLRRRGFSSRTHTTSHAFVQAQQPGFTHNQNYQPQAPLAYQPPPVGCVHPQGIV